MFFDSFIDVSPDSELHANHRGQARNTAILSRRRAAFRFVPLLQLHDPTHQRCSGTGGGWLIGSIVTGVSRENGNSRFQIPHSALDETPLLTCRLLQKKQPAKAAFCIRKMPARSSDGHVFAEVNVLDSVQEFDAFGHWALERFTAGDEAGSAAAFVDHRGPDGIGEVAGAL